MISRPLILLLAAIGTATAGAPPDGSLPKNIILMISDGCGFNHVDAASLYEFGQVGKQVYEGFPVRCAMAATPAGAPAYDPRRIWRRVGACTRQPTDSAAAITAMGSGKKTHNGVLGLDADLHPVESVLELCERSGRATGVVTTVQFCHATPAGLVVHEPDRDRYAAIARTMIMASQLEVIMGAGHPYCDNDGDATGNPDFQYVGGQTTWRSLLEGRAGADADGDGTADPWTLVEDRAAFQALMSGVTPPRVLGVARVRQTLQQARRGDGQAAPFAVPLNDPVPTLAEMARGAINVLDDDPDGFFLMIEGGAVDWASHDCQSGRMIEEEVDFNRAVEAVCDWVEHNSRWDETLVVVTADHECGYLTGPGLGLPESAVPTAATGPGSPFPRIELPPLDNRGQGQVPGMEWHGGAHTRFLVPVYAKGAGSRLVLQYADRTDPVRGRYLENDELGLCLGCLATGRVPAGSEQGLLLPR